VFEHAYGLADRAQKIPNALDTRFRIGSMNKMFTATAIMQLVQAGKIDLDKPFGTYITDYPNKTVSSSVTIRQLLTHSGGTGDIFGPEFDKNRLKLRTLQDYINLYGSRPLRFKPGSKFEYSNYGFILLGAVIERVSGQSYYDYVREHVYEPAGMTQTGSEHEDVNVPNRSVGYTMAPNGDWQPNTDTLPYRGTSAGGGYSTVGDFLKFANALTSNKLLNAGYTQMMTTGKIAMGGSGLKYGFGFGDNVLSGTRCFGHNGGAPGMNGDLEICPSSGYVVVVLSNMDPPAAGRISDFITNRLPQH
jgi:CubicO group peptidase (beta-lactamase class C family)